MWWAFSFSAFLKAHKSRRSSDRSRWPIPIRISTSGRFYSNTNVSLRYFSAGTAPITASDGGSVRFVDQRFFVALHYCHQRIHTEREAGEFVHVQHAGKLHSARHWLPDPHAPDFTLVALAGETDEI